MNVRMRTSVRRFLSRRTPPIRRLPVELLEVIFSYYVHETRANSPAFYISESPASMISSHPASIVNPMTLGGVCRQWRQISRSLAFLWSKFYISHPKKEHVKQSIYWLLLARNSPLTIRISSFTGKPTRKEFLVMRRLFDLFILNYNSWHSIDIHVSHHFHSLFLQVPNYPPPILQSVRLELGQSLPPSPRVQRAVDILYSSPTLQDVAWTSAHYNMSTASKKYPQWATLTHFVHHQVFLHNNLTVNDSITILDACPVLESLDVRIYPPDGRKLSHSIWLPLTHSHLRSFTAATNPTLLPKLIESLILPALEELTIHDTQIDFLNPGLKTAAPILDLLERSSCILREFELLTYSAPEDVILNLISAPQFQGIRKIRLAGIKTERTIDLLTRKRADPQSLAVLPLLEHLTFFTYPSFRSPLDTSIKAIKRMLLSRRDKSILSSLDNDIYMSLLMYANLELGKLDFWDYIQLAKLGNADFTIIPSYHVPALRQWTSLIRGQFLQIRAYVHEF
ncbi:hypothetical protein GALMADRAFT_152770 [Galerina marginata CBS 339.88]|uniref:Uncharacterized protein n=1 Tax=Galerina marginata (strain CBS 339.88) TaxID=685588 RepID=A0A067TFS9_GALM3|nr:hypothetical protein GALMADRAFT_152770 [Galerina marginata CBS 339.88]